MAQLHTTAARRCAWRNLVLSLYRRAMYIREAKLGASSQLAATPTLTPTLLENLPETCKGNNRGTSNRGTCSGTGVAPVLRLYYRGGAGQRGYAVLGLYIGGSGVRGLTLI